tara:strand:- start:767 stop:1360 length:594 start_codon:yes stop_codon:yes gene_type:complete
MKFKIFKFKKVTSTNDVAINLIKNKKKEFGYVYAQTQTKGRGRYGRKWISDKGNLFGTIFFQLKNNYPSFSEFTIINPIIISKVVSNFCSNKKITFKWPNDVLVNKKKICGILQEIITKNSKKFLIIGIGLNLTSNPHTNNKYKATNIFSESNKKPSIKKVINLIITSYEDFFVNLRNYNYKNFKKKIEKMAISKIA